MKIVKTILLEYGVQERGISELLGKKAQIKNLMICDTKEVILNVSSVLVADVGYHVRFCRNFQKGVKMRNFILAGLLFFGIGGSNVFANSVLKMVLNAG